MKCPKCQFENLEGSKFCGGCGQNIDLTCSECGANNPAENNFCNECGSEQGCIYRDEGQANPFDIYFCKTKYNAYKILMGLDRQEVEDRMAERSRADLEFLQGLKPPECQQWVI